MDDYFAAKVRLFENLFEGGSAVINIDDAYGERIVELAKDRHIVVKTYGTRKAADFYIKKISTADFGLDLDVVYENKTWRIPLALAGISGHERCRGGHYVSSKWITSA